MCCKHAGKKTCKHSLILFHLQFSETLMHLTKQKEANKNTNQILFYFHTVTQTLLEKSPIITVLALH